MTIEESLAVKGLGKPDGSGMQLSDQIVTDIQSKQ